ncbi:DUF2492 family protein [Bacteroidota bacterium]
MEKTVVHIHEVLGILMTDNRSYSFDEFTDMIKTKFGEDIFFTSCADDLFEISEVPSFLLSKDKIVIDNDRIMPHPSLTACDH